MEHFATHDFYFAGRTVAEGDPVDAFYDAKTLGHLRSAGWVSAVPAP